MTNRQEVIMSVAAAQKLQSALKQPRELSPRISWLRDYYFKGTERAWNNEYTSWSTGTDWDVQFNEINFYIVPRKLICCCRPFVVHTVRLHAM
jgi:hypothetical protein